MSTLNPFTQETVKPSNLIYWTGQSGARYEFHNYAIGQTSYALPGVYVFSRFNGGLFYAVYVGETQDFRVRIDNNLAQHHAWSRIQSHGATNVAALVERGGKAERLRIETDLVHALNPPANR